MVVTFTHVDCIDPCSSILLCTCVNLRFDPFLFHVGWCTVINSLWIVINVGVVSAQIYLCCNTSYDDDWKEQYCRTPLNGPPLSGYLLYPDITINSKIIDFYY